MTRLLLATTMAVAITATAQADLGPRPPTKGGPPGKGIGLPAQQLLPVNNVLKFGNEFPNHTFWAVTQGLNGVNVVTLKVDSTKPLPLTMNQTTSVVVYAVPNDVAKTFATAKEFVQTVAAGKLPESVVASPTFVKSAGVALNDKRTAIDRVVVVSGGVKAGVKFAEEDPVRRDAKEPEPEPEPQAETRPASRLMAVGLASALAVMFGGVWLIRRGK